MGAPLLLLRLYNANVLHQRHFLEAVQNLEGEGGGTCLPAGAGRNEEVVGGHENAMPGAVGEVGHDGIVPERQDAGASSCEGVAEVLSNGDEVARVVERGDGRGSARGNRGEGDDALPRGGRRGVDVDGRHVAENLEDFHDDGLAIALRTDTHDRRAKGDLGGGVGGAQGDLATEELRVDISCATGEAGSVACSLSHWRRS